MALFNDMVETDTLAAADEILLHQGTTDKRIPFQDAANLSFAARTGYTFLGDHVIGTSYISLESFAVYGGRAYWPKQTTSLPYTATTVNPINDPKLESCYYEDTIESDQIATNTTDIAGNVLAISELETETDANTNAIAANLLSITDLDTRVSDNETNIGTNTTNIATNLTKINSNTARITSLENTATVFRSGSFIVENGDTATISFSSSFPSSCSSIAFAPINRTDQQPKVSSKNKNGFTVVGGTIRLSCYYIAIGY